MQVRLHKEIASGIEQNSFRSDFCVSLIFEFFNRIGQEQTVDRVRQSPPKPTFRITSPVLLHEIAYPALDLKHAPEPIQYPSPQAKALIFATRLQIPATLQRLSLPLPIDLLDVSRLVS